MNIQHVFITGGTGDLGSALVKELLKRTSAHIVTNGRDQSKADELIKTLPEAQRNRFHFFVGDMGKESPEHIAQQAYELNGGIDMLISNVALFGFDDVLEQNEDQKKRLYTTNLNGASLADAVVDLITGKGEHIVLCDIGSTSVIADMLGTPFPDTLHYGKTKADVVRHSIEITHNNPLVSFRAIHPGSINGKIAHEIAQRYGNTCVTTPEITAQHALSLFLSESTERVLQSVITSEGYFAWTQEGAWHNKEKEIGTSPLIEGISPERIIKIPIDGVNSFEVTA